MARDQPCNDGDLFAIPHFGASLHKPSIIEHMFVLYHNQPVVEATYRVKKRGEKGVNYGVRTGGVCRD